MCLKQNPGTTEEETLMGQMSASLQISGVRQQRQAKSSAR